MSRTRPRAPADSSSAVVTRRLIKSLFRARGPRDRHGTAPGRDRQTVRPASPATARRSPSSPTPTAWTPVRRLRRAPARDLAVRMVVVRAAAARKESTSSLTNDEPRPGSSQRALFAGPRAARCSSMTMRARPTVIVPDDPAVPLAIGPRRPRTPGSPARLTGWRIDNPVRGPSSQRTPPDSSYDEEETGGRCAARFSRTGRTAARTRRSRGSAYCGLPAPPGRCVALLRQLRLLHPGLRRAGDRARPGRIPISRRRTSADLVAQGEGGVRRRRGRGTGRTGGRRRGQTPRTPRRGRAPSTDPRTTWRPRSRPAITARDTRSAATLRRMAGR